MKITESKKDLIIKLAVFAGLAVIALVLAIVL